MKKSLAALLALTLFAVGARSMAAAKKQTNRQVIDHFFQVVDSKAFDKLADVDAPDLVFTTPMGAFNGPEGHKQLLTVFATAFPNFKHTDYQCVESGDEIACQGRLVGDHTGPMMTPDGKSIPATKKHVDFAWGGFAKVKNGKVAKLNVYFDVMGMMQQLGLVPAPPKTASR
jgi:predicted ester cyclase